MVLGGISFRHRTPLIIIDGTLTSHRYINEVLRPTVVPFLAAYSSKTSPHFRGLRFRRIWVRLNICGTSSAKRWYTATNASAAGSSTSSRVEEHSTGLYTTSDTFDAQDMSCMRGCSRWTHKVLIYIYNSHLFPLPCGAGSAVPREGFDLSVIILASLLVFSDVGLPSLFVTALSYISCFCQVECTFSNISTC